MRTTLAVDIDYDPDVTDSEGLASPVMNENTHAYALRIDGPLLAKQRQWLLDLAEHLTNGGREHLEGVIALLDEIADQAHDRYGIDCLLAVEDSVNAPPSQTRSRPQ